MRKGLMLMVCWRHCSFKPAPTRTATPNRRDSMIDLANTCATCGGSVSDNYFAGSAFKAVGPGNY